MNVDFYITISIVLYLLSAIVMVLAYFALKKK